MQTANQPNGIFRRWRDRGLVSMLVVVLLMIAGLRWSSWHLAQQTMPVAFPGIAVWPEVSTLPPDQFSSSVVTQTCLVLATSPVRVTALISLSDLICTADIQLQRGTNSYLVGSQVIRSTLKEAVDYLRGGVGWRDRFLFVMQESTGNAWRASVDSVFTLHDGRLVFVGTTSRPWRESTPLLPKAVWQKVEPTWRKVFPERAALAPGYQDGVFLDIYDGLEMAMTCHADGIIITAAKHVVDGQFVVDLDRSWQANGGQTIALLQPNLPDHDTAEEFEAAYALRWAYTHDAAIAQYCGRTNIVAALLQQAEALLPADIFTELKTTVLSVPVGALPWSEWDEPTMQPDHISLEEPP